MEIPSVSGVEEAAIKPSCVWAVQDRGGHRLLAEEEAGLGRRCQLKRQQWHIPQSLCSLSDERSSSNFLPSFVFLTEMNVCLLWLQSMSVCSLQVLKSTPSCQEQIMKLLQSLATAMGQGSLRIAEYPGRRHFHWETGASCTPARVGNSQRQNPPL